MGSDMCIRDRNKEADPDATMTSGSDLSHARSSRLDYSSEGSSPAGSGSHHMKFSPVPAPEYNT